MTRDPVAAFVFDFDGVLADTERLHLAAFQDVFARHGWPLDENEYFARYAGLADSLLVAEYSRAWRLPLSPAEMRRVLADKSDAFRARLRAGDVLFAGAAACVARLGARFPLAIASGALRAEITDILDAAGITGAFSGIVAVEDVTRTKPDPEPYLRAAAVLGQPAERCAAVEDTRSGVAAAHAAGMRVVAITTTTSRADLARAHRIIDHLDELTVESVLAL